MENVVAKQGKVLKKHPPFIMFVSILGSKFRDPSACKVAYKDKTEVKSVHFIGSKDQLKTSTEQLHNRVADILVQSEGAMPSALGNTMNRKVLQKQ
ncbi:hypothetical protein V6N13_125933 [Hibiscus sabdariffa]